MAIVAILDLVVIQDQELAELADSLDIQAHKVQALISKVQLLILHFYPQQEIKLMTHI